MIWVDAWQMQCCGDPFRVGSTIAWSTVDPDPDSLTERLGPELAAAVVAAEEHHDDGRRPTVGGTVRSIRAVHCRYALGADGYHHPVEGASTLTEIDTADGWTADDDGRTLAGYLVTLA
jgi:hypothetical protein